MPEVIEVTRRDELDRHAEEWQGLLHRSGATGFHLTPLWVSTWLDHFWAGKPLLFLFVWEGRELVGLAPLLVDQERSCMALPVDRYSEYGDVVCLGDKRQVLAAILGHLAARHKRLRLDFRRMPVSSDAWRMLPAMLGEHGLLHITRPSWSTPYVRLGGAGGDYLESKPPHFRREVNRKCRKIEKAGRVELRKYTAPAECEEAMHQVLHIERLSWKEANGTSFTARPGLKEFYSDLAARCARKGVLCIYVLRFESEPIAHLYGMVYSNRYHALKTSYSEARRDLSPGVALFDRCLRDASEAQLEEFNLGAGDESRWKRELATGTYEFGEMAVYPRGLLSVARQCMEHKVKPFIKAKTPLAVDIKRWIKGLLATRR